MSKIQLLLIAFFVVFVAPLATAEVSVTGTLTSDYVFRGVSQTDNSFAVQAGLNYENTNGFYAGVWASNVDFSDDADAEIDYLIGFSSQFNQSVSYDISYTYITYTGYSSADNSDYGEFIFNTYFNALTMTVAYAPDYVNSGESAQYLSAAYDFYFPNEYLLKLQTGYSMGDAFDDNEYINYSATVAKTWNQFELTAAVINTNIDHSDTADLRFVFSIYRTF
ncbi:TorF family putative porin [Thalassotalea profundi]|uniref:TIGR02001 family outer membrane protein n=1 Tax=Thalassotalea profundi TaxID=2036687 RepID=A0ABQ3IJC1_9GAMM|nr:TorF family putative porin [Thalassotalea profundi]GHE86312.1 TIGR02001 family outer membrane protein [Thalassotalea profundi]